MKIGDTTTVSSRDLQDFLTLLQNFGHQTGNPLLADSAENIREFFFDSPDDGSVNINKDAFASWSIGKIKFK